MKHVTPLKKLNFLFVLAKFHKQKKKKKIIFHQIFYIFNSYQYVRFCVQFKVIFVLNVHFKIKKKFQ